MGRKRVARLMRQNGIRGATLRKYVVTTQSDPQAPKPIDLVERRFFADAPDQLWVADLTYIPTWSGWLYLAMVMDVYSRRIVGWAMDTNMRTELILEALQSGEHDKLYQKLSALAYFLSVFHNRSATEEGVDFNQDCDYMDSLTERLLKISAIDADKASELNGLRDRWRNQARMWEDVKVLVHGDATPENFTFGDGLAVMAFDLERAKHADRIFDTGRIAGELKHFFMRATGNKGAAEPFIHHFLWEYACHFPDRDSAFQSITGRTPFYMGITLLRIARNSWVEAEHRCRLIDEAVSCLRSF